MPFLFRQFSYSKRKREYFLTCTLHPVAQIYPPLGICKVRNGPYSVPPRAVTWRTSASWLIAVTCGIVTFWNAYLAQAADSTAALLFSRQCSSCHTIGKGDLVGPDLKGVTNRRERPWLLRFIRSSREVVDSGDPTAARLFERYKRQRMPDHDFTAAQVEALLEYVSTVNSAAGGIDARSAESSTPADVRQGFDFFVGNARLTNSAPCAACHSIRHPWTGWSTAMTTFAPELSHTYEQYHDKPLATFIRSPCWPRRLEPGATTMLTPGESFALRAFLRDAARYSADAAGDVRNLERRSLPR